MIDKIGGISKKNSMKNWYLGFGHLKVRILQEASTRDSIMGAQITNVDKEFQCKIFWARKMSRSSFPKKSNRIDIFMWTVEDSFGWCKVRCVIDRGLIPGFKRSRHRSSLPEKCIGGTRNQSWNRGVVK